MLLILYSPNPVGSVRNYIFRGQFGHWLDVDIGSADILVNNFTGEQNSRRSICLIIRHDRLKKAVIYWITVCILERLLEYGKWSGSVCTYNLHPTLPSGCCAPDYEAATKFTRMAIRPFRLMLFVLALRLIWIEYLNRFKILFFLFLKQRHQALSRFYIHLFRF